jgi:hypothetical protein
MKRTFQTGERKKLHTEEIHNLYSMSNIVRASKEEVSGECSTHGRSVIFVPNVRRVNIHLALQETMAGSGTEITNH